MSQKQAADLSKICIRGISGYGQSTLQAGPLGHSLEPSSHDPGGHHTIAISIVARLCNLTEQEVQASARAGGGYIKLCWSVPGYNYPEFDTRHSLDESGNSGDVSFSGGLDWALPLLETAGMFSFDTLPTQPRQKSSTWPLSSLPPRSPPSRSWLPGPVCLRSPVVQSRGLADDQLSDFLDLTSESTVSDAVSLAFSDEASEDTMPDAAVLAFPEHAPERPCLDAATLCLPDTCYSTGCLSNDWTDDDKLAQQQLQNEDLHRQRRDAVAMFAENGDASGLLAVMAAASQSSAFWDPSGMPRF